MERPETILGNCQITQNCQKRAKAFLTLVNFMKNLSDTAASTTGLGAKILLRVN